ncbi:JAB domain-containing protein [Clostridioides difficile]|uniref:JAB domain-containing protein n=1 Tax=Clostridioides difficile TaxID=1496 RepID=UPI0021C2A878|nr:JAB domain-containing protein [Clostridioides difficile]UUC43558.1 JAB domain-containing protein [Clostridioides difficile]
MNYSKRVNIVSIKLVKEFSIRYNPRKVTTPKDAYDLFESFLINSDREKFLVACFNIKNEPINISIVSIGTINSSLVHPREVMKTAILSNSSSIMIAHNHPSGSITPSKEDENITKQLINVCDMLCIKLLDHIIIGENKQFFSFKENSLI